MVGVSESLWSRGIAMSLRKCLWKCLWKVPSKSLLLQVSSCEKSWVKSLIESLREVRVSNLHLMANR